MRLWSHPEGADLMRIGVIAKADNSGLGIQAWEVASHLDASVLLIRDPGRERKGFPFLPDRYPETEAIEWDTLTGCLPEDPVQDWLSTVDVVYAPETLYDWRIARWAEEQGVATVVHANPELWTHGGDPNLAHPTRWWSATLWRREHLHPDTRTVPMPVAMEQFDPVDQHYDRRLRVLHVAGHVAAADRNGTRNVLDAVKFLPEGVELTVRCQDRRLRSHPAMRSRRLRVETGGLPNYWDGWDGYDALLLPRRYGGLCLPAGEACASGMALMMPDVSPNEMWPHVSLGARTSNRPLRAPGGSITLGDTRPQQIVEACVTLLDPEVRHQWQDAAYTWAMSHSWAFLEEWWMRELEDAADAA